MYLPYILLLVAMASPAFGYSAGAPEEACSDMKPQHHTDPQQLNSSPYKVSVANSIKSGDKLSITLKGDQPTDTIKGFMVQVRVGNTAIGKFEVNPNDKYTQTINCGNGKENAVTHKKMSGDGPNSITFEWRAPANLKETIHVYFTTALNGGVFWVAQKSQAVSVV